MRKLLNTLYITSPERYLRLDGENVVICEDKQELKRLPLHILSGIVTFGYTGVSPALMGACARRGISLCFMTRNGRFLASVQGEVQGNVILRKEQYRISDDLHRSAIIARNMILGKLYNTKWILERGTRDHSLQVDIESIKNVTAGLDESMRKLLTCEDIESIRGIEGNAASQYFSVADELILQNKEHFFLKTRNRRPPLDRVNAMLSFGYSLLANQCSSALSSVGLDPYVGFLHRDRPGRASLALDLMEELRPIMVDRFVYSLINRRVVSYGDFEEKENGAIIMTETGRKLFLESWQKKKAETIRHPFLEEKLEWGMVPFAQSLLLSRYVRKELDAYPVFLWK